MQYTPVPCSTRYCVTLLWIQKRCVGGEDRHSAGEGYGAGGASGLELIEINAFMHQCERNSNDRDVK